MLKYVTTGIALKLIVEVYDCAVYVELFNIEFDSLKTLLTSYPSVLEDMEKFSKQN